MEGLGWSLEVMARWRGGWLPGGLAGEGALAGCLMGLWLERLCWPEVGGVGWRGLRVGGLAGAGNVLAGWLGWAGGALAGGLARWKGLWGVGGLLLESLCSSLLLCVVFLFFLIVYLGFCFFSFSVHLTSLALVCCYLLSLLLLLPFIWLLSLFCLGLSSFLLPLSTFRVCLPSGCEMPRGGWKGIWLEGALARKQGNIQI